jgi:hypothetical protein
MTSHHAPPIRATLTMAVNEKPPELLATSTISDISLTEHANTSVKALAIVGFRGSVTFQATKNDGNMIWGAVVSFTDDLPTGTWLNTHTALKGKE